MPKNQSVAETQGISLSSLVEAVASELREIKVSGEKRATEEDKNKSVIEFTECEIELKVGISWGANTKAKGETGFLQLFKLGGELGAEVSNEEANTIKLKFKAISPIQAAQIPDDVVDPEKLSKTMAGP